MATKKEAELTQEQLTEKLNAARELNRQECSEAIGAALEAHKCTLFGIPQFRPNANGGFDTVVTITIQDAQE